MAHTKPIYDLTLLLDLSAADDVRAKIVTEARTAIESDGELLGEQAWGTRQLAYEIDHREAAEYHLLQFSGPPSLINGLEHTLRITDGVIRHRVIKLPAGSTAINTPPPAPAPMPTAVAAAPEAVAEPAAPAATEAEAAPAAAVVAEPVAAPAEPEAAPAAPEAAPAEPEAAAQAEAEDAPEAPASA